MTWSAIGPLQPLARLNADAIMLQLMNQALEVFPPDVMIWQHNDAPNAFSTATAWKIIRHCGYGWTHPFFLPRQVYVRIHDGSGSGYPLAAAPGQELRVFRTGAGDLSFEAAFSHDPSVFQIRNLAERGTITVEVWRGSGLLAIQPALSPGIVAPFRFPPTLFVSAVSNIEEGRPLVPTLWLGMPTDLNLLGVIRADLVMVGGGPGATSSPLRFYLHNVATWPV